MNATQKENILRRVRFAPYRKGMGPTFNLTTWDTGRSDNMGKWIIGYRLMMSIPGTISELFEGEDFHCSPLHAIDSDETIAGLMAFLTLRPGDTDSEYFEGYTAQQLEYCSHHAEALACEAEHRFGKL